MNYQRFLLHTNRVSLLLVVVTLLLLATPNGPLTVTAQQPSVAQLEAQYQKQYEAILGVFANSPGKRVYPMDPRLRVREWQSELSDSFTQAARTVDEILKLNPADAEMWRERRETLGVYARPVGNPAPRTVFGATEVKPRARLMSSPAALYPNEARQAGADGEVRLRLVLAADGTVKHIFPMKSLNHGLTEAAIEAAKQITFEPAMKTGRRFPNSRLFPMNSRRVRTNRAVRILHPPSFISRV